MGPDWTDGARVDESGYANVYDNPVVGVTANPLMTEPDAVDAEFAEAADRALQAAVELIRRLVPSHQSAAAIVVQGDWKSVRKYFSLSRKYQRWAGYRKPARGVGLHAWMLEQKVPVRLTDAELVAHPAWLAFGSEAGKHPPMRGWLSTPLLDSAGVCWGLLQLSDRLEGDYTADDEAAMVQFTDLLSLTLETLWQRRNDRKAAASAT